MGANVPAICAWAWFQTSYGFISLKAWFWEMQNPQFAVDATAGVYSSVGNRFNHPVVIFRLLDKNNFSFYILVYPTR